MVPAFSLRVMLFSKGYIRPGNDTLFFPSEANRGEKTISRGKKKAAISGHYILKKWDIEGPFDLFDFMFHPANLKQFLYSTGLFFISYQYAKNIRFSNWFK
ncbi:MAG: hypothetical protein Fur0012_11470 [Elusimicrobiota bacterium]